MGSLGPYKGVIENPGTSECHVNCWEKEQLAFSGEKVTLYLCNHFNYDFCLLTMNLRSHNVHRNLSKDTDIT